MLLTSLRYETKIKLQGYKSKTLEVIIMLRNLEAEQARFGYTNADMAELLGISRVTYERKKCSGMFNRPQIDALLRLFDCKFEYLFAIDDQQAS